jgi:hypothetical protein
MARVAAVVPAAMLWACIAQPAPAKAEASLIGVWQHCEPGKGCSKFAFLPNGWVIEQFPLAEDWPRPMGAIMLEASYSRLAGNDLRQRKFACWLGRIGGRPMKHARP